MKDAHAYATMPLIELYRWFAGEAEVTSPVWGRLCRWIAETPAILRRLDTLPGRKRQPNLFLGALRYLGGPTEGGPALLAWVDEHWDAVAGLVAARATQTNEPGRCAVLAPVLAALPQPIELLEAGASAGLCLIPDRYRYRYTAATPGGGLRQAQPAGSHADKRLRQAQPAGSDADKRLRQAQPAVEGSCEGLRQAQPTVEAAGVEAGSEAPPDAPVLECAVTGTPPGRPRDLRVAYRAGLDPSPLRADDPDDARWLRALVWPGEDAREARLAAALELAARDAPPVRPGRLPDDLDAFLALAPAGLTPVLLHSATLAYLARPERDAVEARVRAAGVRWVSFEGPTVVTSLRGKLPAADAWAGRPHFIVALDGEPLGRCGAHGGWVDWF